MTIHTQQSLKHIGVIGAGAWGTALASAAARAGRKVTLWALEPDVVSAINTKHMNHIYLADIPLPATITATNHMQALETCDVLLLVPPAQFMHNSCKRLDDEANIAPEIPLVICAKGIENKTSRLMSEVVEDIFPHNPLAVLMGPGFAEEVEQGVLTAVSLACTDEALGRKLIAALETPDFSLRYTPDPIGAQVAGAVKNILAIGCGIIRGLGLGDNISAALIALGLSEMGDLVEANKGSRTTLLELCGVGDLVLTCSSMQSRNMSFGYALGEGKSVQEILAGRNNVTEGVASSEAVMTLAQSFNLTMPVCSTIYNILHNGKAPASITNAISHS